MRMLIIVYCLLILSCCGGDNVELNSFFKELEEAMIDSDYFEFFKSAADLEVFLMDDDLIHESFSGFYYKTAKKYEPEIRFFLHENGLEEGDDQIGNYFLILLFHNYLNGTVFKVNETLSLAKEIHRKRKLNSFYLQKHYEIQIDGIVDMYLDRYQPGDFITLVFPIHYNGDEPEVYSYSYPTTLDWSSASDTLFLTGSIVEMHVNDSSENSLTINFEITKNSRPDLYIFDKYYFIKDTFSIDIRDYARLPYGG